jgi:hypothetical protein
MKEIKLTIIEQAKQQRDGSVIIFRRIEPQPQMFGNCNGGNPQPINADYPHIYTAMMDDEWHDLKYPYSYGLFSPVRLTPVFTDEDAGWWWRIEVTG